LNESASLTPPMQPQLALTTGHFHERPVTAPLQESFACVWVHRMQEAAAPPILVIPDGTIDVQWIDGRLRVAGPDKEPATEVVPAGSTVIGFRFRPAVAAAWLHAPMAELLGQRVLLDDLWGAKATRLAARVRADRGIDDLIASLADALAQCRPARPPVDVPMRAAYDLIKHGPPPGAPLVPWLARALAMSDRTLRRRFDESFGYGPKTLDRILRYQRYLQQSRVAGAGSIAMLAADAGYADQAHLVRESRRLSGSTPAAIERMLTNPAGC
jgi:AraC-like DNA-binding protein